MAFTKIIPFYSEVSKSFVPTCQRQQRPPRIAWIKLIANKITAFNGTNETRLKKEGQSHPLKIKLPPQFEITVVEKIHFLLHSCVNSEVLKILQTTFF